MKQIHGIYLPESDTHFDTMITPDGMGGGTYQLKKYKKAMDYCRVKGTAIDIGAHVGLWSRVMARDFEQVIAFEPLTDHRDCFSLNVDATNVTLFPYALSNEEGTVAINMPMGNTGHSHVIAGGGRNFEADGEIGKVETVKCRRLDSFKWDEKTKIDFIKIDVEGWEVPVVLGAEQTIKAHKPVIIIEQKPHGNAERYGRGRQDALRLLLSWGFKLMAEVSGDYIVKT